MKIKVGKTSYEVTEIDSSKEMGFNYTIYILKNKNTHKTLIHNTTVDNFTLWGRRVGNYTMTLPKIVEFI